MQSSWLTNQAQNQKVTLLLLSDFIITLSTVVLFVVESVQYSSIVCGAVYDI